MYALSNSLSFRSSFDTSIIAIRGVTRKSIGGDPAKAIGAANKTTKIKIVLFTIAPHLFVLRPDYLCQSRNRLGATLRVTLRRS
jgi:hypothetical protein